VTGPGVVLTEDEYQTVRSALDQARGAFHDVARLGEVPERSAAWVLARLVGDARDALRNARARTEAA
jgi:hypothetical protein